MEDDFIVVLDRPYGVRPDMSLIVEGLELTDDADVGGRADTILASM